MKTIRTTFAALLLFGLGGCGYPYYGEGYWAVEVYGDPQCWDCHVDLEIELNWDSPYYGSSYYSNLDLSVRPPTHAAGCGSLGNDPGSFSGGSETVICDDPPRGTYEVRAVNWSDTEQPATVVIRRLGGNTILSETEREIRVGPWGTSLLDVRVE